MAVTRAQAETVTTLFCRAYPDALNLAYYFRDTVQDLYGSKAHLVMPTDKGGFVPSRLQLADQTWREGRVDVVLANTKDDEDLIATLQHEVLGHYAFGTLPPGLKRAALDALLASQQEPSLSRDWTDIHSRYGQCSLDVRAEEVLALFCERIPQPSWADLAPSRASCEAGIAELVGGSGGARALNAEDVASLARLVSARLLERSAPNFNLRAGQSVAHSEHLEAKQAASRLTRPAPASPAVTPIPAPPIQSPSLGSFLSQLRGVAPPHQAVGAPVVEDAARNRGPAFKR